MQQSDIQFFQNYILNWYHTHGRFSLPWRQTTDPYKILVSELMLQQTQVDRVIPKYSSFMESFPTTKELNTATLAEVLQLWQGLGYNRRAKFLHAAAQKIEQELDGEFPKTTDTLLALPGVGPYTASAVMAFAYNQPVTLIETNVRTVFLYHFFPNREDVCDAELLPLIEKTVPETNAREWYSSLMDYGTHLKKTFPNPSRKSKHHTKQSKFIGSPRQVRGSIIRELTTESLEKAALKEKVDGDLQFFEQVLHDLLKENMIQEENNIYRLSE